MNKQTRETNRTLAEGNSLRIMGVFFAVFGVVLWVAILFTEDRRGQLTDFGTGLALCVIGTAMFFRGRRALARLPHGD